jgi:DNA-binding phage protein
MPVTRNSAVQGRTNAAGAWMRKSGRETIWMRAQDDARFREAMLTEAINELLAGDLEAGKAMLRDYVNATITFDGLAKKTGLPGKSLQRMLGPSGNPTAESLFGIIKALQAAEHIRLAVKSTRRAA